jgi:methyl-accepting chemotaxis protein-1 (serine sensor receptor)
MLNNISLRLRLIATMACIGLLLVLLGLLGVFGMRSVNQALHGVYTDELASTVAIGDSKNFLGRARFTLDRAVLHPDAADVAKTIERANGFIVDSDKSWKTYMNLPHEGSEDALAKDVDKKRRAYVDDGLLALSKAVLAKDTANADALTMKALAPLYGSFDAASIKLGEYQVAQAKESFDDSELLYERLVKAAIGALVLGALVIVSSIGLLSAIMRPLDQALEHFDAMAKGDLSTHVEVTSRNEMGQLLEGLANMQAKLATTVRGVRDGSGAISAATAEIAAGNLSLSARTEEQAGSLEETAASLEELTATVRNNADNARLANQLATTASDVAVRGGELVSQVVDTMGSINQSSKHIVDIIAVIDGIAFQTNILALNAAVEAARAGEQGRGFAVVATEVRNLAHRSASAAKEIKELISASVVNVQAGAELVDRAGATMKEIVTSVASVTNIMSEMMTAGDEQSSGIAQINQAVAQMDQVTQQNAALVEEAAAAAVSLQDQAAALEAIVSVFQVEDDRPVQQGRAFAARPALAAPSRQFAMR